MGVLRYPILVGLRCVEELLVDLPTHISPAYVCLWDNIVELSKSLEHIYQNAHPLSLLPKTGWSSQLAPNVDFDLPGTHSKRIIHQQRGKYPHQISAELCDWHCPLYSPSWCDPLSQNGIVASRRRQGVTSDVHRLIEGLVYTCFGGLKLTRIIWVLGPIPVAAIKHTIGQYPVILRQRQGEGD